LVCFVLLHPEWVTDNKRIVCRILPKPAFSLPANRRQRKTTEDNGRQRKTTEAGYQSITRFFFSLRFRLRVLHAA
ncbi:MAG: hypothetical protein LBV47_01610, partial [Bacteroidales bacterium]|nr:hypothetical protein [Bacteroidales bacterium]